MTRPGSSLEFVVSSTAPTSSQVVKADGLFAEVLNMRLTRDDTLETVREPVVIYPALTNTAARAVCYAEVRGGARKVLLCHDDNAIKVFKWGSGSWYTLAAPSGGDLTVQIPPETDNKWAWPTQFVPTPTGVVIAAQGAPPLFYDGEVIAPLGFDSAPDAPDAYGPRSSTHDGEPPDSSDYDPYLPFWLMGTNDIEYNISSLPGTAGSAHYIFGECRLGTVSTPTSLPSVLTGSTNLGGGGGADTYTYETPRRSWLQAGTYRAVRQDVDTWGNLSPVSAPSADIRFDFQPARGFPMTPAWISLLSLGATPGTYTMSQYFGNLQWVRGDLARRQVAWGVTPGRDGVVARILGRTKDVDATGDVNFYELPLNATGVVGALGTLPDNVTAVYPDNIPDAWLTDRLLDVAPVPRFKLATLAFGSLWIANFEDDEGAMMSSEPGLWGTFRKNTKRYPDPRGGRITGLHTVKDGMLVFTETSTFLYTSNDGGDDVRRVPISTTIGCVAPSSIETLRNGETVWLAEDGFYTYAGGDAKPLFGAHKERALEHNPRALGTAHATFDPEIGVYLCWVAVKGARRPNRCYMYDGAAWRWREDIVASGSCRAGNDVLVAGEVSSVESVFVMNKGSTAYSNSSIDTGWLKTQGEGKRSIQRIILQLKETIKPGTRLTVSVYTDYNPTAVSTDTLDLAPTVDSVTFDPTFWGDDSAENTVALAGATANIRRPFFAKADVHAPGCSTFRIKVDCDSPWEFFSMAVEFRDQGSQGAQLSRRRD